MLDWLLFNTFLPLMPIPLTKGVLWLCGLKRGWANLVRDGQICFYSTSLCAISIHDFFKLPKSPINAGLVVATLIFFMLFSTSIFAIGVVMTAIENGPGSSTAGTSTGSTGSGTVRISDSRMGLMSLLSAVPPTVVVVISRSHWGLLS